MHQIASAALGELIHQHVGARGRVHLDQLGAGNPDRVGRGCQNKVVPRTAMRAIDFLEELGLGVQGAGVGETATEMLE